MVRIGRTEPTTGRKHAWKEMDEAAAYGRPCESGCGRDGPDAGAAASCACLRPGRPGRRRGLRRSARGRAGGRGTVRPQLPAVSQYPWPRRQMPATGARCLGAGRCEFGWLHVRNHCQRAPQHANGGLRQGLECSGNLADRGLSASRVESGGRGRSEAQGGSGIRSLVLALRPTAVYPAAQVAATNKEPS